MFLRAISCSHHIASTSEQSHTLIASRQHRAVSCARRRRSARRCVGCRRDALRVPSDACRRRDGQRALCRRDHLRHLRDELCGEELLRRDKGRREALLGFDDFRDCRSRQSIHDEQNVNLKLNKF